MLSAADNALLTQTGPGTPMGTLFRRFWLPALLSSELVADGTPVRIRMLGEDLLAFRNSAGDVGVVEPYCSHKLAPLFFGRNEECGLRCVYHGWKFDVTGACVDLPNVDRAGAEKMKPQAAIRAYPAREAGGVVWINMGPKHQETAIPDLEWTRLPAGHVHISRWLQRTNYAQGLEGEIDSSHISFLHRGLRLPGRTVNPTRAAIEGDGAPVLEGEDTPYGIHYGSRRNADHGTFLWRTTHWLLPFYSLIPGSEQFYSGRAWVPVDDHHVMTFNYLFRPERPFDATEIANIEEGGFFPPLRERVAYQLPHGAMIDTYLPIARRENDYEIDRNVQRTQTYTGIRGANDQDRCLQENMISPAGLANGATVDRSREHLVASDRAAIMARRSLLRAAQDLQNGVEPRAAYEPSLYGVRAVSALTPIADFAALKSALQSSTLAAV
jgi:phthalate 4,5-dioxygenase oxygenase subunit